MDVIHKLVRVLGLRMLTYPSVILMIICSFLLTTVCIVQVSSGTQLKSWVITANDTASYEFFIDFNDTAKTLVDKIVREYNVKDLRNDFWGQRILDVRVKDVPQQINVTSIALAIVSFSGPVSIEQKINGSWIEIKRIIIPFFVPIGCWEELNETISSILPHGGWITCSYSWTGEYTYHIFWHENGYDYDVKLAWEHDDGVLQAIWLTVGSEGNYDSLSMYLCGQKLQTQKTASDMLGSSLLKLVVMLAVLTIIGILVGIVKLSVSTLRRSKLGSNPKQNNLSNPNEFILDILAHWKRKTLQFSVIWSVFNIISFLAGLLTFDVFLMMSEKVTNPLLILVVLVVCFGFVGAVTVGVDLSKEYLFGMKVIRPSFKTSKRMIDPTFLLSSMIGLTFPIWSYFISAIGQISSLQGRLTLIGLYILIVALLLIAYFIMNPWTHCKRIAEQLKRCIDVNQTGE